MSANDNRKAMASSRPLTLERIEEMLLFAAQLVDSMGAVAQPLLDRMEKEYLAAKQRLGERPNSKNDRCRLGQNDIHSMYISKTDTFRIHYYLSDFIITPENF